ncbi:UNVERIFIED_CONTAM: hypothetical protein FKN15_051632 [Acipenser sinensis]
MKQNLYQAANTSQGAAEWLNTRGLRTVLEPTPVLEDAEEKLEESHQTVKTMERAMEKMKEELRRVKTEFSEQSRLGKRAEQQRNEALINAEKLTVAFQQNKDIFSEKLKKVSKLEQGLQKQKQAAKEELGNTEEKLRKVCQESEDKERQVV